MLDVPEFSVEYLRTNFLQLLVWKKYFKTECLKFMDYILMYLQLYKLLAYNSVCFFMVDTINKPRWNSVVVTERNTVRLINEQFLFDISVPAFSVEIGKSENNMMHNISINFKKV